MSRLVTIKKIDNSIMAINLDRVVSVELIPVDSGNPYYAIVDTNDKTHLVNNNPLAAKAHYPIVQEMTSSFHIIC